MTSRRENSLGVLFLALVAFSWGFVAPTVKVLTAEVDSNTISLARVALGLVVFLTLFVARKGDWRRLSWTHPWIIAGALGRAGNYLLYNGALVKAPSNAVTILAPVQTISMLLLARAFLGERIRHKWLGLTLSMLGLGLIWWNGQGFAVLFDPEYALGNIMLIAAGVASAFQFISNKVLAPTHSSLEILVPVFGLSTLITLPFSLASGGFAMAYSPTTWALLLTLGLLITGGSFFLLAEGYRRCAATTAVIITNCSIFFVLLNSHFLLHEPVGGMMIVGALLGVAGAVAVVAAERRQFSEGTA
jgi:drug/metabolite transporter (DMT)-like permease